MKVIVAIDDIRQAEQLAGLDAAVKVGLPLIVQGGQECLEILDDLGFTQILYDGKFFDIPSVVYKATRELKGWRHLIGITVHAKGGVAMMRAAKEAAGEVPVYGVTELTSAPTTQKVLILAKAAYNADLAGVVAPAHCVVGIKHLFPLSVLCPGIRLPSQSCDEHTRPSTPTYAQRVGADAIIIGRPITQAADPRATYLEFVASLKEEP